MVIGTAVVTNCTAFVNVLLQGSISTTKEEIIPVRNSDELLAALNNQTVRFVQVLDDISVPSGLPRDSVEVNR